MNKRLKDKVAIISGGAGGIGSEAVRIFCEEGASVAIVDLSEREAHLTAQRICEMVPDANIFPIALDLGVEENSNKVVNSVINKFGKIDILVNNVGIRQYEPLAEASWERWNEIVKINLLSYASLTRSALPFLRKSRHGSVINVSSCYAVTGRKGMGAYDATKAGVLAFTRTLAWEEAEHGVRSNAICPGYTLTPFHISRAVQAGSSEEEIANQKPPCVMQRWAEPKELAYPMLWLASDEASYVTGATIMVDGGLKG